MSADEPPNQTDADDTDRSEPTRSHLEAIDSECGCVEVWELLSERHD